MDAAPLKVSQKVCKTNLPEKEAFYQTILIMSLHFIYYWGLKYCSCLCFHYVGKYYYEVTCHDQGLCRVGWSTSQAALDLGMRYSISEHKAAEMFVSSIKP